MGSDVDQWSERARGGGGGGRRHQPGGEDTGDDARDGTRQRSNENLLTERDPTQGPAEVLAPLDGTHSPRSARARRRGRDRHRPKGQSRGSVELQGTDKAETQKAGAESFSASD